jgi:uncharacterized protein (DUF427 family)
VVEVLELTEEVQRHRAKWRYRGDERPAFAEPVAAGEESAWDFPRPPRCEPVTAELRVVHADRPLASTRRGVRILETAGAPTYYFPPEDVDSTLLVDLPSQSLCEWKGLATSFALSELPGASRAIGWRYESTFPEFVSIRAWSAFYPGLLACFIGTEQVQAQPGGYYGGWVSANLKGPIKGEPGSESW